MRRVEICVHREKTAPLSVAHLLFLFSGVWSLLLFLSGVPLIQFPAVPAFLCGGASCVILWLIGRDDWNAALRAMLIFIAVWMMILILARDVIRGQSALFMFTLMKGQTGPVDVTETACLFAALIAWTFFTLEYILESHLIPWLATTSAALAGPSFGVRPAVEAVMLAFLFQISFWTMHEAGLRQSRSDFPLKDRSRMTSMAGLSTAGLLLAAFLIAAPFAKHDADAIYQPVYHMESVIRSALSRATGRAARPASGGVISRGNSVPSGTEQFVLKTDRLPGQPVYLRGFSGGEYTSGEWLRAGDDMIFQRMAEEFEKIIRESGGYGEEVSVLSRQIAGTFYTMYFTLNTRTPEHNPPIALWVRHTDGFYRNYYLPYYGWRDAGYDGEGYLCRFYEQDDMCIDWDALSDMFYNLDGFRWIQAAYIREIQEVYTRVPEEILPRLSALCRDFLNNNNNNITPEAVTAFILYTLQSKARYSLTPGWIPWNQEPVEYFLFESGMGYCQHFASAAVLMYRMCGIPARYATGYAAWPEDFQSAEILNNNNNFSGAFDPFDDFTEWESRSGRAAPGESVVLPGSALPHQYQAVLTDASAHAWVEIFLPDYGWTPVEVTPASDGNIPATWPGLDRDALRDFPRNPRESVPDTAPREQTNQQSFQSDSLIFDFFSNLRRVNRIKLLQSSGYLIFILSPFGAYLFYHIRRERRKRASCRVIFGELLSMFRFAGLSRYFNHPEPDGQEDFETRFPEILSRVIPDIDLSDARRFFEIIQTAAYGPPENLTENINREYGDFARRIYDRAAGFIKSKYHLRWWKRPLFQYWFL